MTDKPRSLDLPTPCVMGDSDPAIGVFYLNRGCVALRQTTVQPLCLHHANIASPIDRIELIKDLTVDGKTTRWWKEGRL